MDNTREKSTDGFYDITKTWFEADHSDSKEDNITVDEGSGGQARVKFNLQDQIIENIANAGPDIRSQNMLSDTAQDNNDPIQVIPDSMQFTSDPMQVTSDNNV